MVEEFDEEDSVESLVPSEGEEALLPIISRPKLDLHSYKLDHTQRINKKAVKRKGKKKKQSLIKRSKGRPRG